MIKSRIVTGPTGKTGSVVVAELLRDGYPSAPWCAEKMAVARS
jgi:hypothetical protein